MADSGIGTIVDTAVETISSQMTHLTMIRGDSASFAFAHEGSPTEVRFYVRTAADGDLIVALALTTHPAQIVVAGDAITVSLLPDDTDGQPAGTHYYDCEITEAGEVTTPYYGRFVLRGDVATTATPGTITPPDYFMLTSGARAGATSQAQSYGSLGIKADIIAESTSAAGVTVDGVLIKDGLVDGMDVSTLLNSPDFGTAGIKANVVAESTSAAGVTVDGVLLKDGLVDGVHVSALAVVVNVRDYGATGDGVTDDTAALQAAINALDVTATGSAAGEYAQTLWIPHGVYLFSDTLTFQSLFGMRVLGAGLGTRLVWNANNNAKAALDILDCRNADISNFNLSTNAATGKPALALIRLANTAANGTVKHMRFHDLFLGSNDSTYCILVGGTASVDANNDFAEFDNCEIYNNGSACVYLGAQSQAYNWLFINCCFAGDGTNSQYGIDGGPGGVCGGFKVLGGSVSGFTVAAFRTARSSQPFVFDSINEEGCAKFLSTSASYQTTTIRNCRLSAGGVGADLTYIDFGGCSILIIEDCMIGDGLNPTVALKVAKVAFGSEANTVAFGRFVFNRNLVFSTLDGTTYDDWPFDNSGAGLVLPTEAHDNLLITDITQAQWARFEPCRRPTVFSGSLANGHTGARVIRTRTVPLIDYATFGDAMPYSIFTVICDGANTFYDASDGTHGDNLYLAGHANWTATAHSSITFFYDYDNDAFVELSRSQY